MKQILGFLLLTGLFTACKKTALPDKSANEPITYARGGGGGSSTLVVTTSSVFVNSAIMTIAYGEISLSGGGNKVTERGFCYHTSSGPTIANNKVTAGSGYGQYQATLTGLTAATSYYVRAYAIKSGTVYYGNELNFTTLSINNPTPGIGVVYDYDGNAYNTLTYGGKVWMLENLKTTHYRDGSLITNITSNTDWSNATSAAYSDYDNNPANSAEYGRLYNLFAVKDSRNIAPVGWHVASLAEWRDLANFLGGAGIAGGRMKEAGFTHWLSPNTDGSNSGGFTALGSGKRYSTFSGLKSQAIFWGSNSSIYGINDANVSAFILNYDSGSYFSQMGSIGTGATFGYSVRCVKD